MSWVAYADGQYLPHCMPAVHIEYRGNQFSRRLRGRYLAHAAGAARLP